MSNGSLKVFKKEAREMLRDKRVRSSALFGPFFLVLMMMFSFGTLMNTVGNKKNQKFYLVNSHDDNPLVVQLKEGGATVVDVPSYEKGKDMVAAGKAPLVAEFPKDFAQKVATGETTTVNVVYDPRQERSQIALSAIQNALEEANNIAVANLLKAHNLPSSYAAPAQLHKDPVGTKSGVNEILIALLPYLIIFWAFIGGMSTAADLVAGEKEKNTLETLLITPVPRTQIVWGKFLSLVVLCLSSSLSGLAAVFVAANSHMTGMNMLFKNGTGLGPVTLLQLLVVLIPTACFFASMLLAISTFARNSREAQTYLGLASLAVTFPAISSQFIGFSESANAMWINFVPVLNASAAVRAALIGTLDARTLLLTTATSTLLAIISIYVAVKLFNREEVLLRV